MKYIFSFLLAFTILILDVSQTNTQTSDDWKANWTGTMEQLDSVFYPIQRHFRLMQTYQNDADEKLIMADIDSLNSFIPRINDVIDTCNKLDLPYDTEGNNASEAVKLKTLALKEYFEQCMFQIQINNKMLQKKLKHESLAFKVSQIPELMLQIREYVRFKK